MSSSARSSAPASSEYIGVVGDLLGTLIRSEAFERGDVRTALAELTEASATALSVERASVWRFSEDRSELVCVDLFERSPGRHTTGQIIRQGDAPRYFASLDAERTIAAHDAQTDPRTSEFAAPYLVPNGITSMLDAPIVIGKSHAGVVCHEHVGEARTWTPWEALIAGTFADFAVMVFGAEERGRQQRALDAYRTRLEQLVEQRTRELRESEEAFRQLFEAAPVALVLSRLPDHHIVAANPSAATLLGVPEAEALLGDYAPNFYVDPSERSRLVGMAQEQGNVDGYLARMQKRDGGPFWADLAVRFVTRDAKPMLLFGIRDITVQHELEARLRELATIDELTRVLNRRRLFEIAEDEIHRATRYGRALSVAMFDIDNFKRYNDEFGHATGDETLRLVSSTIELRVRKQDQVGRYGGEELMVVFPETTLEDAAIVTERTRAAIEALEMPHDGRIVRVTVSAGVVQWKAGEDLNGLFRRADEALYAAKAAGRNRVIARPVEDG